MKKQSNPGPTGPKPEPPPNPPHLMTGVFPTHGTTQEFDMDSFLENIKSLPKPQAILCIPTTDGKFAVHKMDLADAWEIVGIRMGKGTFRVRCSQCGKPVSNAVSMKPVVRAYVQCPECIEKSEK